MLLNVYGFLHGKEKNLNIMLNLFRPISIVLFTVSSNIVFSYFSETLEKYIDGMDQYLSTLPNHEDKQRYLRSNQFSSIVPILLIWVGIWWKGFEIYFPLVEVNENQSKIMRFSLMGAFVFSLLPTMVFPLGWERMKQIFMEQMILAFGELQRQMRMSSEATLENLESSHNEELAIEKKNLEQRNRVAYLFNNKRNAIYKNFDENMVHFVQKHEKLVKYASMLQFLKPVLYEYVLYDYMIYFLFIVNRRIHLHVKIFLEFILSMSVLQTSLLLVFYGTDILQV